MHATARVLPIEPKSMRLCSCECWPDCRRCITADGPSPNPSGMCAAAVCAGLPFNPDFAVTHITQLSSRAGEEELRAGPTPWGTVLELPASWAEAVASAELPDEEPLHTALEVRVCVNR